MSDLPAVGQEVRVTSDAPRRKQTAVFRNLSFEEGDPLLVRLTRFDKIVDLRSIKVP